MAEAISLTDNEQLLYDDLQKLVEDTQKFYSEHSSEYEEQEKRYETMKHKAHELHMALKDRGYEPKHHAYMYKNRGVQADDLEFYNHLHPVEDLLAFISDPDANNDPEDSTIGVEFDLRIYTNRWGHYDMYSVKRTENGWVIDGASTFRVNNANKSGDPALFKALEHDCVNYPQQTGELLEHIWYKAENGASKEEVQKYLNDFAEWISICEKTTPSVFYEN